MSVKDLEVNQKRLAFACLKNPAFEDSFGMQKHIFACSVFDIGSSGRRSALFWGNTLLVCCMGEMHEIRDERRASVFFKFIFSHFISFLFCSFFRSCHVIWYKHYLLSVGRWLTLTYVCMYFFLSFFLLRFIDLGVVHLLESSFFPVIVGLFVVRN